MESTPDNIEIISTNIKPNSTIFVSNLMKKYDDGNIAVKSMSFAMVEGQITCLLGSNGAGKSTTISVLTGLLRPTLGNINIYGYDLLRDLHKIRKITGICLQQNVLFPLLTVSEHLRFFGTIKGLTHEELLLSIDKIIQDIGLQEKKHVLSKNLSGGQKRKLW